MIGIIYHPMFYDKREISSRFERKNVRSATRDSVSGLLDNSLKSRFLGPTYDATCGNRTKVFK